MCVLTGGPPTPLSASITGPVVLDNQIFAFTCQIAHSFGTSGEFEVTFLFDGKRDDDIGSRVLRRSVKSVNLFESSLRGRLNKQVRFYLKCKTLSDRSLTVD